MWAVFPCWFWNCTMFHVSSNLNFTKFVCKHKLVQLIDEYCDCCALATEELGCITKAAMNIQLHTDKPFAYWSNRHRCSESFVSTRHCVWSIGTLQGDRWDRNGTYWSQINRRGYCTRGAGRYPTHRYIESWILAGSPTLHLPLGILN